MRQPPPLKPIQEVIVVSKNQIEKYSPKSISVELIGEKAFGLSALPYAWTLPFIVISDILVSNLTSADEKKISGEVSLWITKIKEALLDNGVAASDRIIVRSSGHIEGLKERGSYYSAQESFISLDRALIACLNKLIADKDLGNSKVALIVQKYATPVSSKGHLSNERRVYEEPRDWLGEYDDIKKGKALFKVNLRKWRRNESLATKTTKPLACNMAAHVPATLRVPAKYMLIAGQRVHFEWVWDGSYIYIVQADRESGTSGIDPTKSYVHEKIAPSDYKPSCLSKINETHAKKYQKIKNVDVYRKLKLPVARIYILEDRKLIKKLAKGIEIPSLRFDLNELVKYSLVIRIDIATTDQRKRQLLPRTHEVRDSETAFTWLSKASKEILAASTSDDVAFIFHNFIPAKASAFALAAPGQRKVVIEALWGLPEGLYYYSHDKYVVDTLSPVIATAKTKEKQFVIERKKKHKKYFVAPESSGEWTTQEIAIPFDWRQSIKMEAWVTKIALESRRIAEEEGETLSIMWFVGVPKEICTSAIFPWHHEPYHLVAHNRSAKRRVKKSSEETRTIRTSSDIERLKQEIKQGPCNVACINIEPHEDVLIRNKNTLKDIGELAKEIDAVILLNGGVLSHAYYQLCQTGAKVETLHEFDKFEDKHEFNKLVRDRIPEKITSGGEYVRAAKLKGDHLLRALKEKLIEEAFEVLDAPDKDSIVEELADVCEVIDGVLTSLDVQKDELLKLQKKKRKKAGGFKNGLILLETDNPLPTTKPPSKAPVLFNDLNEPSGKPTIITLSPKDTEKVGHKISTWSDKRVQKNVTERVLKVVVPAFLDKWTDETPEMTIDMDDGTTIKARMVGSRNGANIQVELSIFTSRYTQLKLL